MTLKNTFSLILALCVTLALSFSAFATPETEEASWPERLATLEAETAILMDGDTGQVLFAKQGNKKMHPASITKILTALLVLENTQPNDVMTASKEAVQMAADSASIELEAGEKISVEEGLYALMVASANDAANVLAEHVSGTQEDFSTLMNGRLAEIGAVNSHFENPHGLTARSHLTTAYDMALIMKEAMSDPEFEKYFGISEYTLSPTNLNPEERELFNYHFMLREELWAYAPEVVGGKTGFTNAAGSTLCTWAEKDGRNLLAVVLKSGGEEKFSDTQLLLDYGFSQFSSVTIPTTDLEPLPLSVLNSKGETVKEATLTLPAEVRLLLPLGAEPDQVVSRLSTQEYLREENLSPSYLELYLLDPSSEFSEPLVRLELEYEFSDTLLSPPRGSTSVPMFVLPADIAPLLPLLALGLGALVLAVVLLVGYKRKRNHNRPYGGYYP